MLLGTLVLTLTIFTANGLPYTDSSGNYHGVPHYPDSSQVNEDFAKKDYYDLKDDEVKEEIALCPHSMFCLNKHICPNGYLVIYDGVQETPPHQRHCHFEEEVCCKIIRKIGKPDEHLTGLTDEGKYVNPEAENPSKKYNWTAENSFLQLGDQSATVDQITVGESFGQVPVPVPHYADSENEGSHPDDYYDFTYQHSAFDGSEDFISICPENTFCVDAQVCIHGYFVIYDGLDYIPPHRTHCNAYAGVCCKLIKKEPEHPVTTELAVSDAVDEEEQVGFEAEEPSTEFNQTTEGPSYESGGESASVAQMAAGEAVEQMPEAAGEDNTGIPLPSAEAGMDVQAVAITIQSGCAAALLCVEEKFCTMDGTISPEPVMLTSKQILRRVPLSNCKNPETGIVGKCCRDPNYVDPWPTGNLPPNYNGGFDEMGFPTFLNIAKVRPPKQPVPSTPRPIPTTPQNLFPIEEQRDSRPTIDNTNFPTIVPDIITSVNELQNPVPVNGEENREAVNLALQCGIKNKMPRRPEMEESETVFAEIPWQAMVLHSKERRILCSGALIGTESVLTAGNCVDNLSPSDVSIKLGEWKLGYELQNEEPLPFEILNVSSIRMHPSYSREAPAHDLALLHLEGAAKLGLHVNPLCLPETENVAEESRHCIATGWGKTILQAHYAGAIMHAVNVNVLPPQNCRSHLSSTEFNPEFADGAICAKTEKEKNNVCEADIGGPLACENERGYYELAGVYSQDTGCFATNQVAVFAPIDKPWLETIFSSQFQESNEPLNDYRDSNLSTDNHYLPPN